MKFSVRQIAVGGFDHNFSYVVAAAGRAVVIDPSGDAEKIFAALAGLTVEAVLLTHLHRDHWDAAGLFNVPVHSGRDLRGMSEFVFGCRKVGVLHTPGHTPESLCFLAGDALFTGDTLFVDYVGYGDTRALYDSLALLRTLPDVTLVYPGHDYGREPFSSIGVEKKRNPYFREQPFEDFARLHREME
ncbi:MAG: MBL fold metallo-hydrolase [Victivallaceae bacterium]|nr:MBL fold metallo-hydrolase [Victivallaceae bacterium]